VLVETAHHSQRGTSWFESSRNVSIDPFILRIAGSEERILVSPGNLVHLFAPEPRPNPLDTDRRSSTIEIRPGDVVTVSGSVERTPSPEGGDYRNAPRAWRLRASDSSPIVVTTAGTAQSARKLANNIESKVAIGAGFVGIAMVVLMSVHLLVFQLAGPIVTGTVTGSHDSTDRKTNRTTTLAEITYPDSAGGEHRLERGYAYFTAVPRVGMQVRVRCFPGLPADADLAFDTLSLGFLELLGGALSVVPLLLALVGLSRAPRADRPRVCRVS
jgi:hypothetical protein